MDNKKRIAIRNGMVMSLQESIRQGNNGDTSMMKKTLKAIQEVEGYKVETLNEGSAFIDGERYISGRDKIIMIKEEGKLLFTIYKDKRDDMVSLDVNPCDLMTDEELNAFTDGEQEAEKAMNMWAGGIS